MKTLRIALAMAALAWPTLICAQMERGVSIKGVLQVFDGYQQVCREARGELIILAEVDAPDVLSLEAQTSEFDRECQWLLKGTLRGEAAKRVGVAVTAKYRTFVVYPKKAELSIYPASSGDNHIERTGVRVTLYSPKRARDEARAEANRMAAQVREKPELLREAVAKYTEAATYYPDPEALFAKADLLERHGKYQESAQAWRDLIDLSEKIPEDEPTLKNSPRFAEAPWRLVGVLRRELDKTGGSAWFQVAEEADRVLKMDDIRLRERIIANWLDALFLGSESNGDYRKLAQEIQSDPQMRDSWNALYKHYKRQSTILPVGEAAIVASVAEIERSLGRPN